MTLPGNMHIIITMNMITPIRMRMDMHTIMITPIHPAQKEKTKR